MSNPNVKAPGHTKWKKGQSGNPSGKPAIAPHLREFQALTADEVKKMLGKYGRVTVEELDALLANKGKLPALEAAFASALKMAIDGGDISRIDFYLNRLIGKVKDETVHTVNFEQLPTHELVKAGQRAIAFLTKAKEPQYEIIEAETISEEASPETTEKT